MNEKQELQITEIWKHYRNGKTFLNNKGLATDIPDWVKFYEGNQWPPTTKNTKDLPRPVFNVTKMIINNKASNILGSPIKLNFIADNDRVKTDKFTKFANYIRKEIEQNALDDKAVMQGLIKGTYVYYYYWSEPAVGKKGRFEGGLRGEIIDPLNVYVADPSETDCQKQEFIGFSKRMNVKRVRELLVEKDKQKYEEKLKLIVPDELETDYDNYVEMNESELVTVITEFFKKDGEVYYQRATKNVVLHDPIPFNPYLNEKEQEKDIEENSEINNEEEKEITKKDGGIPIAHDVELEKVNEDEDYYKATLYPIEIGSLNPRDNCIWGISEVADIKETQKVINFLIAMGVLNAQLLGSPKTVVKQGALQGQKITNRIGEVLIDHTPGNTRGIEMLEAKPFTAGALQFAPSVFEFLRTVTNSTEIITGDMISKDLSGTAIAQLQAQSMKPVEHQQKRFWRSQERIGKIQEMFFKLFYEGKKFSYEPTEEEKMFAIQNGTVTPETKEEIFNGYDYQDTRFNVVVEAGAGTQYSEIQSMNILNNLLQAGKIDLKTYVELYPQNGMPFKAELKQFIAAQERSELNQLRQLVQEQSQALEQNANMLKDYEKVVKDLSSRLQQSNKLTEQLKNEYSNKLMQVNDYINRMSAQAQAQPQGKTG